MNAPYMPDLSLKGKIRRRITRFSDRKPLPRFNGRYVSFTFDDFPKSSAVAGAKALEDHDILGTYYACAGQMGISNHFGQLFDEEDLLRLTASGHEIGCHTHSHIDCATSSVAAIQRDIIHNQEQLSRIGIPASNSFAFPFGDVSFSSKHLLANRYATLRGVQPGINQTGADANQLLAVPLEGGQDVVNYALSFLGKLNAKPGWLIFFTHDVSEQPSNWGCTPNNLRQVIAAAKSNGFNIDTVSTVYETIQKEMSS